MDINTSMHSSLKFVLQEYLNVLNTEDNDIQYYNSQTVYKDLFHSPVERIFFWSEEDYQGSLFVIYKYVFNSQEYFIGIDGGFGSCSGCDAFEGTTADRICNL